MIETLPLERICANKLRILRSAYVSEKEERCRRECNYDICPEYIPLNTEESLRRGINAFFIMRGL